MGQVLKWSSDSWNAHSAKSLLQNLQKNKGQTNEAREHAALILSWMELRQNVSFVSPRGAPPRPPAPYLSPSLLHNDDDEGGEGSSEISENTLISPASSTNVGYDGRHNRTGVSIAPVAGVKEGGDAEDGMYVPFIWWDTYLSNYMYFLLYFFKTVFSLRLFL